MVKPNVSGIGGSNMDSNDLQYNIGNNDSLHHSELLRDLSLATGGVGSSNMSGLLLNNRTILGITDRGNILEEEGEKKKVRMELMILITDNLKKVQVVLVLKKHRK